MTFVSPEDSHAHSLEILNVFQEFDDFMESIGTLIDLGCGRGLDLEWWATRTTRDERRTPLNIKCVGVDLTNQLVRKIPNVIFQGQNFESPITKIYNKTYDFLWCHNAFQYVINPLSTLVSWRNIASPSATLAITVKQTTNIEQRQQAFVQESGSYYHYTLVNLIHILAVSGWDCANGYFKKEVNDPWITVIAYRGDHEPLDPVTTTWYELAERNLLPESAAKSVMAHGQLRQQDLILPWMDKSLTWFGKH